jgi:predicted RNase H-like HicB family nuclease
VESGTYFGTKFSAPMNSTRYRSRMAAASVDFTISFDNPDEEGWIVARVLEVPGAMSQGRTREEARENALDALRTVLTPDEDLSGKTPESDREHLRFTAAA